MNDTTSWIPKQPAIDLEDAERQPCEVWTRVMGYHRPVASFNIGKKGEHYERRFFREAMNERAGERVNGPTQDRPGLTVNACTGNR
jgi:hypothetical protein